MEVDKNSKSAIAAIIGLSTLFTGHWLLSKAQKCIFGNETFGLSKEELANASQVLGFNRDLFTNLNACAIRRASTEASKYRKMQLVSVDMETTPIAKFECQPLVDPRPHSIKMVKIAAGAVLYRGTIERSFYPTDYENRSKDLIEAYECLSKERGNAWSRDEGYVGDLSDQDLAYGLSNLPIAVKEGDLVRWLMTALMGNLRPNWRLPESQSRRNLPDLGQSPRRRFEVDWTKLCASMSPPTNMGVTAVNSAVAVTQTKYLNEASVSIDCESHKNRYLPRELVVATWAEEIMSSPILN